MSNTRSLLKQAEANLNESVGLRGADSRPQLSPVAMAKDCLLYTSPSPRDQRGSRMPSSA